MAKIKFEGKEAEVADGGAIKQAAMSLGVPFSCEEGVCGSCLCNVVSGEENLSEPSQAEQDFGLSSKKTRLCCQTKIKKGEVELESGY